MPKKSKKKPKKIEPVVEEEVVTTAIEAPEPSAEELAMTTPEAKPEELEPILDVKKEPPKKTLEEQLLEFYNNAPIGPIDAHDLAKELGTTEEKLTHAWDRLYDQHKIEFSKFVKSCESYP